MTLAYLQIRRIDYSCVATSAGIAMRLSEQAKWMVRNVYQANPSIRTAYPELFAVIGGKTPDYRSWFLRGGTAGQAGNEAQDSIRSHAHELTEHAHTLSIKDAASKDDVASMTPIYDTVNVGGISGVPIAKIKCSYDIGRYGYLDDYILQYRCPQYGANFYYQFDSINYKAGNYTEKNIPCGLPFVLRIHNSYEDFTFNIKEEDMKYERSSEFMSISCSATLQTQSSGSSSITYVSGMKMTPGSSTVNGTTDPGGAGQTRETGGVETAPKHKFVRYLIRARP